MIGTIFSLIFFGMAAVFASALIAVEKNERLAMSAASAEASQMFGPMPWTAPGIDGSIVTATAKMDPEEAMAETMESRRQAAKVSCQHKKNRALREEVRRQLPQTAEDWTRTRDRARASVGIACRRLLTPG